MRRSTGLLLSLIFVGAGMSIVGHYLQWSPVIVGAPLFLIVGNYARTSGDPARRRRERRIAAGRCVACGYNLTGNISGVCPECGTAVAKDRAQQQLPTVTQG
jgi:hypothetical protein